MTPEQTTTTRATGILNIDKPAGWTSHDIVAIVRKLTGQRRIGHAGTLDPAATGVLVLCMGLATRMVEYVMEGEKMYYATVHLGATTETYDAVGTITPTAAPEAVAAITPAQIEATLQQFTGRIEQVPPMYSAIKQQGQQLYKLARQGIEVERKPRSVEITSIELLDYTPPVLELRITCSKGTYIRSLAHDIGQALGTGAYLEKLVREASGHFRLEEAVTLDEFRRHCADGTWQSLLLPMDDALLDLDVLILKPLSIRRMKDGVPWRPREEHTGIKDGTPCRVYSTEGIFSAIAEHTARGWMLGKHFMED